MAQYQNLFTSVQVVGPTSDGIPLGKGNDPRLIKPFLLHLAGRLGNAQIGPIYLGSLGLASLVFGILSINIMGMNMLASVNFDPIQFVRQLFWLALEPPAPVYGLQWPPLNQGGWWMIAGLFLTISIFLFF